VSTSKLHNVVVAPNSLDATRDIRNVVRAAHPHWKREQIETKVVHLANYYPVKEPTPRHKKKDNDILEVGCFGAIRPLKNQLLQAIAAVEYANIMRKHLRFHVNASRCEQRGDNVLKNLRSLFANSEHELIEHDWLAHDKFIKLVSTMDVSMCVSLSETFNIVAADSVVCGVPLVCSPEITWSSTWSQADPTDSEDIIFKIMRILDWRMCKATQVLNLRGLRHYCTNSRKQWIEYLDKK
jgi:hypothetical protein